MRGPWGNNVPFIEIIEQERHTNVREFLINGFLSLDQEMTSLSKIALQGISL
jgi:hypothetical protein